MEIAQEPRIIAGGASYTKRDRIRRKTVGNLDHVLYKWHWVVVGMSSLLPKPMLFGAKVASRWG